MTTAFETSLHLSLIYKKLEQNLNQSPEAHRRLRCLCAARHVGGAKAHLKTENDGRLLHFTLTNGELGEMTDINTQKIKKRSLQYFTVL